MSDPRDRSGDPPADSDAFEEWVEHTAETRGIGEQELLNQLVSAFWVLDEMNGLTDKSDVLGDDRSLYPPGDAADTTGQRVGSRETDRESRESGESAQNRRDAGDDGRPDRDAPDRDEPARDVPDRADAEPGDHLGGEPPGSAADESQPVRESVGGQLEVIQAVAELRRQVTDLSLNVERQRSRQDQFTDRISDDLTRLHSRVETLDAQIDEADSVDEAEIDRLSAEIDQLESTQREFETWIDEEFDEIEALFESLLETTDTLETRLDAVDSELDALRDDDVADRLAALRREAVALDTDTGRCEQCESTVDLSMLDEPACPNCDAAFASMEAANGWNPFAKPRLHTADDRFEPN